MQYDVHRNLGATADRAPYLVDLQSDRVEALGLRVVAPLVHPRLVRSIRQLHPEILVDGQPYILSTAELFAIERRRLGPVVDNLDRIRHRMINALDLLFTGV